jgi:hypothetical protein
MKWLIASMLCLFTTFAYAEGGEITFTEEPQTQPDIYTIQPGDTLWEISTGMMGNPYEWPQLWSFNEYITNPHWIYPGNRLVFTMGDLLNPPRMDLDGNNRDGFSVTALSFESTDTLCGPDVHFNSPYPTTKFLVPGFVARNKEVKTVGRITKSPHNQSMMSEHDLVYLKVKDPNAYTCGDILTVYRRTKRRVRHPNARRSYGSMYRIVGEAKVVHRYGNYLTASIRSSWDGISRGDLVGPPLPTILQLDVQVPTGELSGVIVERLQLERSAATEKDVVFIDRGTNDGIMEGESFYIIQQRDEYLDKKGKDDRKLPPKVIGRLVVVAVNEDSSTAVVTDASRLINVGATITQEVD